MAVTVVPVLITVSTTHAQMIVIQPVCCGASYLMPGLSWGTVTIEPGTDAEEHYYARVRAHMKRCVAAVRSWHEDAALRDMPVGRMQ